MRALITGVGGFVGRHLLHHLQEEGDEVCGLGRAADILGVSSARVFQVDLSDRASVDRVIREVEPEAVYHLARRFFEGACPRPFQEQFQQVFMQQGFDLQPVIIPDPGSKPERYQTLRNLGMLRHFEFVE